MTNTAERGGPRPLPLHLAMALQATSGAVSALAAASAGALVWHPSVRDDAARLMKQVRQTGLRPVGDALTTQVLDELDRLSEGIDRYRCHPFRRAPTDAPIAAQHGAARLLDLADGGTPLLLVPSLVNGAEILDLLPGRSLVESLRAAGFRPLLVDWGTPGPDERRYDLAAYVTGPLTRFLDTAAADGPVAVVGYCMGGNLALAATLLSPDRVERLALLATPWDFHAGDGGARPTLSAPHLAALAAQEQPVPVDILQAFFAALDPTLTARKFTRFASLDPTGDDARIFVAMEDWANGGPPLAAGVAHHCLANWYGANAPARGQWRLDGHLIDPAAMAAPTLVAVPRRDRIVPPLSALALAKALPQTTTLRPPSGHVGMIVGGRAVAGLHTPLVQWLTG